MWSWQGKLTFPSNLWRDGQFFPCIKHRITKNTLKSVASITRIPITKRVDKSIIMILCYSDSAKIACSSIFRHCSYMLWFHVSFNAVYIIVESLPMCFALFLMWSSNIHCFHNTCAYIGDLEILFLIKLLHVTNE